MASQSSPRPARERHFDARALRFVIIFPLLLIAALSGGAFLLRASFAEGAVLPAGGDPVPLVVFLTVGAGSVLLPAVAVGVPATRRVLPSVVRRSLMGVTMALQLAVFSLFVAALLGQGAHAQGLPPERVSGFVFLMGSGLSAAMGVVLGMTFKPEEQWTRADDLALAQILSGTNERLQYFVHPRSSVIVMILLIGVLPGGLLALITPWLGLLTVVLALFAIGNLCASVELDHAELRVKLAAVLPVIAIPVQEVDSALALAVLARNYGGVGLRKQSGREGFLASSGAAVVLRMGDGGTAVIGAPNLDVADEVARLLNRGAGKSL